MLRSGGLLTPSWHVFQLPSEVTEASAEVYARVVPDSPFNIQRRAPSASSVDTRVTLTR